MDATAALRLLGQHGVAKVRERTFGAPEAAGPPEFGQTIDMFADDAAPPPPAPAAPPAAPAPADAGRDLSGLDCAALVAEVFGIQELRVAAYRDFDVALKASAGDAAAYAAAVAGTTLNFAALSARVNAIEAAMRAAGAAGCGGIVRAVQLAEKQKLELTAARHLTAFRGDSEGNNAHVEKELRRVVEEINDKLEELRYEASEPAE
ncbi:hypothetical protein M885DRAFT_620937 [Pelagophyceae sp. CCMP2097]|nr:hypothetical protein M885DRAFT_620937 [Pelagophyceae sp. CCMP2097]